MQSRRRRQLLVRAGCLRSHLWVESRLVGSKETGGMQKEEV